MRVAFAILMALHGLLHLLGAAAAFGWTRVDQLKTPITPAAGVLWLLAAALLVAAAFAVGAHARWWWAVAVPGVLLSQSLIMQSWSDARFGTIPNVVILVPLLLLAVDARPSSFRSRFRADARALLARPPHDTSPVREHDLRSLPPLMQAYLRRAGVVGRPRVHNMRIVFDAQMRNDERSPWMQSTATQYEFMDPPLARLFYMTASRAGLPFDVFHRYMDGAATFQVRIASLFPMVDSKGPAMTKAETVTLMNDIVVLAPAAVLGLPFTWQETGDHTLHATFTNAGYMVAADLQFDRSGDLIGFTSDDRMEVTSAGTRSARWSTPLSDFAEVNGTRVPRRGNANWIEADGHEWTYGRFTLVDIAYNVTQ